MLKLDNVSLQLGPNQYSFTLTVEANSVVAVLGKSGSGKSTLLNIIAGFLKPDAGNMSWHDQSLIELPANERPVTSLFQQHNLFTHLSVRQNIGLGISPDLTLTLDDQKKIEQALFEVGMQGHIDKRASTLSGGEQQRVALARCLLRDQPILLLDEPFSALDEATRHDMIELTKRIIHDRKLCTILVTHNKDDAKMMQARKHELVDGVLRQ